MAKKNVYTENRVGKFMIDRNLVVEDPEFVTSLFAKMELLPVRVEQLFAQDSIEYIGFSPWFKKSDRARAIREYPIVVTQLSDGTYVFQLDPQK